MDNSIIFYSYNSRDAVRLKEALHHNIHSKWLSQEIDLVFQICDELLKNAFKSNYKFLLLWEIARKKLMKKKSKLSFAEADTWLREVFYAGENVLLEKQLKDAGIDELAKQVRLLIDLENQVLSRKKNEKSNKAKSFDFKFEPLLKIKKLAREHKVYTRIKLEETNSDVLITVSNASPILDNDVKRIQGVRQRFREYYDAGRPEFFFIENIDTSGGGHGLGYALMDSILLQMGLEPEKALYLIPAGETMVLLVLPFTQPALAN